MGGAIEDKQLHCNIVIYGVSELKLASAVLSDYKVARSVVAWLPGSGYLPLGLTPKANSRDGK